MLESSGTTVVASQLASVNISQASANQRAGRTGRIAAGICYRLYTRKQFEQTFEPFTKPEMLRLDLQHLVLHSLSMSHRSNDACHPLTLLLGAPDPPSESKLQQTLHGLASQGLVDLAGGGMNGQSHDGQSTNNSHGTSVYSRSELTPLGTVVGVFPVSPRMGRLLFVGLAFRAVEPALSIAALLSMPSGLQMTNTEWKGCSDIVLQLDAYHKFLDSEDKERSKNPQKPVFELVTRVREQLKNMLMNVLLDSKNGRDNITNNDWEPWNTNSHRVGAISALISNATPHIAHLVGGKSIFATRDNAGSAKIHPGSTNFDSEYRTHWYLYHHLRTTTAPYLHGTTAVSPLEVALFADSSADAFQKALSCPHDLFVADQWVPVEIASFKQRDGFLKLRRILTFEILQQLAVDHRSVLVDSNYNEIVPLVLAAIEQQRLPM